jgi:rhamnogalacturonan endolyase
MKRLSRWYALLLVGLLAGSGRAQPIMERLGRGVVAINQGDGKVFISWRLLGTDPDGTAFNLYRAAGDAAPVKLNPQPISGATCYVDSGVDLSRPITYTVRPVVNGAEAEPSAPYLGRIAANAPARPFIEIPIQCPPPGQVMDQNYTFSANDASVADLDGDGEYEFILKWEPSNSKRPPQTGFTGPHIIDAYKLDGTRLWRIDLGKNVRAGAAFTQFMVYDLDGDGKAEMVCRTCDGTIDGTGKAVGDPNKDWRTLEPTDSPTYGKSLHGPEYVTVFDGLTGAAIDSQPYIPVREPIDGWGGVGGNGGNDNTGNRSDHFSACVAYLDGVHPSVVMIRGWYGRTVEAAWDYRDHKLVHRWTFDSALPQWKGYSGMGNHQVTVADFDGDGKDEICVGAMVVDDDGKGLFTTGLRHGDALHAGDLDPTHPGLEVYGAHENEGNTVALQTPGAAMYDGKTGKILWSNNPGVDVARALAADIDPNFPGAEGWGSPGGTRRADTGEVIYPQTPSSTNFAIWWDGDLLRELENGTQISKWDWKNKTTEVLLRADGVAANNGTKSTPCLTADLFGDWREEVIWRTADNTALRIYTTTIPTDHRFVTLMHDPQYRLAIAWQNCAYNQPPWPSYFIGQDMKAPPKPNIATAGAIPQAGGNP